jgi:hypothetical protein
MPWGKFRDQPLNTIDSGYLCWVLDHADRPQPWLKRAVREELRSRFSSSTTPPRSSSSSWRTPCPDCVLAANIVSAGFHTLAKKHHPDVGGDTRTMQQLNATAQWLKSVVLQ